MELIGSKKTLGKFESMLYPVRVMAVLGIRALGQLLVKN
jgi:hypothetical protein